MAQFLTVPESTPDLSTHFEDLAYKFPSEPVERAIVRFCEAVARWRGLPELGNVSSKDLSLWCTRAYALRMGSTRRRREQPREGIISTRHPLIHSSLRLPRGKRAHLASAHEDPR